MITILTLGPPQTITVAAWDAMKKADKLYLQTLRHPFAKAVLEAGLCPLSMDDLYQSQENFDALNQAIAARLADASDCVYAVTGSIRNSQLPLIMRTARARGVEARCLPGVPLWRAAYPEEPEGQVCSAWDPPITFAPDKPAYVEEVSSRLIAGEIKLRLMEFWPEDWKVYMARASEEGEYGAISMELSCIDRQEDEMYHASTALYVPAASFEQLKRYGFEELIRVMERLRGPGGCPWDREQTHESLKQPLIEECYELIDAIEGLDDDAMVEELGDVLMQVAFHSVIAQEQARFSHRDVTTALVSKLIYRHPHVFGDVKADTSQQVLANWDQLKKKEKDQKSQTEVLQSVPKNLPALMRSKKVQKKAADVGFDWSGAREAFYKIGEETEELRQAMEQGSNLCEELGDLLFSVVNVARLMGLEPEFALSEATDKFIHRFDTMERLVKQDRKNLEIMNLEEMDKYWDLAKKSLKQGDFEK